MDGHLGADTGMSLDGVETDTNAGTIESNFPYYPSLGMIQLVDIHSNFPEVSFLRRKFKYLGNHMDLRLADLLDGH